MRKITSILITISIVFVMAVPMFASGESQTALNQLSSYWPAFRGSEAFKGLTDAKTPTTAAEIELKWNVTTGAGMTSANGFPIEVGEFVYYSVKDTLVKLNKETGAVVKTSAAAVATTQFFSTIAYGDGKIFVPLRNGLIQAFDADTLASVWVSQACPIANMQCNSPVTYHDGYIYMGVTAGAVSGVMTSGMLYCLSTSDDDPDKTNEVKNYTWSYNNNSGYYWSEGVVVGNNIVFGGDTGVLVSHHLTENVVTDTLTLEKKNGSNAESVRSSAHYDRDTGRVYVSTKAGTIHSVKINADGTFNTSSYMARNIGNDITSSPATYKGRLYVGGGGVSSGAGFSVLNSETLELIYQIPGTSIASQSSPVISTAYATAENNWKVYIYLLQYTGTANNKDRIFCVSDAQGQTTSSFTELVQSPNQQYNSSSLAVGKDGTLYYRNDSYRLFAFKNKNSAYTATDMINAINRLPALNKLAVGDEPLLSLTEERMAGLSSEVQVAVTNAADLTAARNRMTELTDSAVIAAQLIEDIAALPTISELTLADNNRIQAMLTTYNSLPELDRPLVTNINILMSAAEKIKALSDANSVAEVIAKINALPTIASMSTKGILENAFAAYNDLSGELKAQVTNVAVLTALSEKMTALETEITAINDAIWALDPENITLADKAAVESIIARYNQLSEGDRAYVEYFDEVLGFKAIIDALETGTTVLKDTKNNTKISVTADNGILPEDTELVAIPIASGAEYDKANIALKDIADKFALFDISLLKNNVPVDLNGKTVLVSIPVPDGFDASKCKVFYIDDDSNEIDMHAVLKNGFLVFETSHFSNYAVAQMSDVASPKTGDDSNPVIWIFVCVAAMGALIITSHRRKQQRA